MSAEEYEAWRGYILNRSGLDFPESRRRFLLARLGERIVALGLRGYGDYMAYLTENDVDHREWLRLRGQLINPETQFFRHPPSYEALASFALPHLFEMAKADGRRFINIWSAGCSTGQETWSLAMSYLSTVAAYASFPEEGAPQAIIVGTDIIDSSLTKAKAGRYYPRDMRLLPSFYRAAYMTRLEQEGEEAYEMGERIRKLVHFRKFDLLSSADDWPVNQDIIFCHNVLMHFDRDARHQMIERFARSVALGGFLFLTPSESVGIKPPGLVPTQFRELVVYRREG